MCVLTLKSSHRPDGKMADMPKSTLIFRFWIDIWFYQGYVRAATPANFPSPPWETHVLLVFTGRRCLCQFRHRHNDVLLNHRQHSFWIGACSCSKLPIAPMGKWLTCLPRLALAQLRTLLLRTVGTCHRDLKTSHRPDGKMLTLLLDSRLHNCERCFGQLQAVRAVET